MSKREISGNIKNQNKPEKMYVVKRNGDKEPVYFDKIPVRIRQLCEYDLSIDPVEVSQKVIDGIRSGITTEEIDILAAESALHMSYMKPEYEILAKRLIVSNLHKKTNPGFSKVTNELFEIGILNESYANFVKNNSSKLDAMIVQARDYNLTFFGYKTLEKSYLNKNIEGETIERPQHMFMRVATFLRMPDMEAIKKSYDYFSLKKCTHATPTLFHAGYRCSQLSSCYLQSTEDELEKMYETITEGALISKHSGGIGVNISMLRSSGSRISSTGGHSDGIIPYMKVLNDMARHVNQGGGKRKGSVAVYLEPHHPDLIDFLQVRKNNTKEEMKCLDIHIGLWISDLFMKRLEQRGTWSFFDPNRVKGLELCYGEKYEKLYKNAEKEKLYEYQLPIIEVWKKILVSQMETGEPYILFKDHVNRKSNQINKGVIKGSNLCVHGETMILTRNGYYPIESLVGKSIEIWNGSQWSTVVPMQTGEDQQLLTVSFSNYTQLKCTPYHKFYIETSSKPADKNKIKIVEAKDLSQGMKIIRYDLGICEDSKEEMKYAYTHGLFSSNDLKDISYLELYANKKKLISYVDYISILSECDSKMRLRLPEDIEPKYRVPLNSSKNTKLEWLAGFFDGDGCVTCVNNIKNIHAISIHLEFLKEIFLMLQTIGINSSIVSKECVTQNFYRINIDPENLLNLIELGFETKRLDILNGRNPHHKTNKFVVVKSVKDYGETSDTFCVNEPLENKVMFNGILTGNCAEIAIYSDKNSTGVCNLCSIALPSFVDEETKTFDFEGLADVVEHLTENMNIVIEKNYYPIESARKNNMELRPIGIGIQGLADVFQMMDIAWSDQKALDLDKKIYATMYYHAMYKSCLLAQRDGPYEYFKGSPLSKGKFQFDLWGIKNPETLNGVLDWDMLREMVMKYGVRNSLLIAQMPTASTAQIFGNNESMEPYTSNMYVRQVLSGNFPVINQHMYEKLDSMNLWNQNNVNNIIQNGGSIQGIRELDDRTKEIFKTSWEIPMKIMLDHSVVRGPYICQTQSFNCFMSEPTVSKLSSLHMQGWKRGLKTGSYYIRRLSKVQPIKFTVEPVINTSSEENAKKQKIELDGLTPVCTDDVCLVCSS